MNNRQYVLLLLALIGLGASSLYVYRSIKQPRAHTIHPALQHLAEQDAQMITFLQHYIRIETTHPNPDYGRALALLKKQAQQDGFTYQEIALPSGNPVLVITHPGTNPHLPALALNHHIDVVPAPNTEQWMSPPFAAEIHDGVLVGRGVQDMKGIGVAHYFALKALKDAGIQLKRTVHILAVPDEERGGFKGTKEFVETDAFKKLNIGFVIDEGSASGNEDELLIKVSEKKPIQIRITSTGSLAHGSNIQAHNAIHELINFLQHIVAKHHEQQAQVHNTPPGLLLSMNITSLQAGIVKDGAVALNVVPDQAQATVDIRVPPIITLEQVHHMLKDMIRQYPHTAYTIEATVDDVPFDRNYQTPLYETLAQTIAQHQLQAKPHYFEGATDVRYYKALGIDGIGFTPFTVKDNIHGTNESVPVNQLIRGKNIMLDFIKNFCLQSKEKKLG